MRHRVTDRRLFLAWRCSWRRVLGVASLSILMLIAAGCDSTLPEWVGGRQESPATAPPAPVLRSTPPGIVRTPPSPPAQTAQPTTPLPAPTLPDIQPLQPLHETLPPPPATLPKVGLLLPLSGPNAELGQALLRAAELALFDAADDRFVLLPRDTGGRPEHAATAAASAVADGASLILGPVFAASAEAVKLQAQLSNIRVIAFSNDRSVADQNVYVMGITPESQVARIVAYARGRGLLRFASLAPDTAYGAAVVQTYRQAVAMQGGVVSTAAFFDPRADAKELETVVKRFVTTGGGVSGAVFLPAGGHSLRAIAPLLSYYATDTDKVQLLGTALWEEPGLGREPALVGGWFVAPPPSMRQDFERRYGETFGSPPPRLATLAYDAVALAAVLARNPGSPDFTAEAIAGPNGFLGVDGIFRFLADGTIQRGLAVLRVRRNGFEIVDPAPTTFQQPIN